MNSIGVYVVDDITGKEIRCLWIGGTRYQCPCKKGYFDATEESGPDRSTCPACFRWIRLRHDETL